jgi:hypothetical protein
MTTRDAIKILEEKEIEITKLHGHDNEFGNALHNLLVEVRYKPDGIRYQDIVYKICQLFDTSAEKCTIDMVVDKVKNLMQPKPLPPQECKCEMKDRIDGFNSAIQEYKRRVG